MHAMHSLEGHIVPAILLRHFLVVPRVKVNQRRNVQSSTGSGELFDVKWHSGNFQCMSIGTPSRADEAVLHILFRNSEVTIPVGAPSELE